MIPELGLPCAGRANCPRAQQFLTERARAPALSLPPPPLMRMRMGMRGPPPQQQEGRRPLLFPPGEGPWLYPGNEAGQAPRPQARLG